VQEGYKIRDQTLPHFITATIVDWVDVFTRKNYRDIVVECLDFCIKNKAMVLYGYVIMSNHVHMVVQSGDGELSDLLRDFKKFTATKIIEKIKSEPESRREWMLERFKLATESHSRNKIINFGNMAIIPKKFIVTNLCGQSWIIFILTLFVQVLSRKHHTIFIPVPVIMFLIQVY
jgi:REP element-mobilizing transposase RayT